MNDPGVEEKKAVTAIFPKQYYEIAYFDGIKYLVALILRFLADEGVLAKLKQGRLSCEEIIKECGFIPETGYALEWMLSFLSQEGFLEKSEERADKRYHFRTSEVIDPEAFLQQSLARDAGIMASAELMKYVLEEYPKFFRGLKKGLEILFAQDKIALWNGYFSNENSGYRVYNALGALGVLKWSAGKNNLRFLEIGGGTGGASSILIARLKENAATDRIAEYIFSDISPVFLRTGNREIMKVADDDFQYRLKRLDFNKPFTAQGVKEDSLDLVYGVNSLHVAKDLVASLRNIYVALKPGGMVIIAECCRPAAEHLFFQEVIFNLLDNYVNVDLDKDLRPVPGFLDYKHWKKNLEAAGFRNIEAVFNTDAGDASGSPDGVKVLAAVIKGEKSR